MKIGEKLLNLGRKIFSKKLKATEDSGNYCFWFFYNPKKPKMFD